MKHTKGPWIECFGHVRDTEYKTVALIQNVGFQDAIRWDREPEECLANARLISCAPEMLEALERLVKIYHDKEDDSEAAALDQAMDAIKKARGE